MKHKQQSRPERYLAVETAKQFSGATERCYQYIRARIRAHTHTHTHTPTITWNRVQLNVNKIPKCQR